VSDNIKIVILTETETVACLKAVTGTLVILGMCGSKLWCMTSYSASNVAVETVRGRRALGS